MVEAEQSGKDESRPQDARPDFVKRGASQLEREIEHQNNEKDEHDHGAKTFSASPFDPQVFPEDGHHALYHLDSP